MIDNKATIVAVLQGRGYAIDEMTADAEIEQITERLIQSSEQLQAMLGKEVLERLNSSGCPPTMQELVRDASARVVIKSSCH